MITQVYKTIFALAIILSLGACKHEVTEVIEDQAAETSSVIAVDQKQFESSNFELGKIEKRSFAKTLEVTGAIHIPERSKASVSTLMSGTIGAINLTIGQWVTKGQTLFAVTNPELINLQEEYLVANGELEYLTEEYERQKELAAENLSTRQELLKAKSELNTTRARQGSLKKKLNLYGISTESLTTQNLVSSLSVRAPIAGYVSGIHAMRGSYIDPNEPVITLQNTAQMYLELAVLERDALRLEKGQKVIFTLQGDPTQKYEATVDLINRSINEQHMIAVNCKIDKDSKSFVPGMYAHAEIVLADYQGDALPETGVIKVGDTHYALSLVSKASQQLSFEQVAVETGVVQDGYVEVVNPIKPAAEYLTKGAYFLIQ